MNTSSSFHHFGLYIHIPVCTKKCSYCDFYSVSKKEISDKFWQEYFDKLKNDLDFFLPKLSSHARLGSIFFGGGTPSLSPLELLEDFLSYVFSLFSKKIYSKIEITLEANPENISAVNLKKWHNMNVNRIHVGIQSNNPKQLQYLERQTTVEQNNSALRYLQESSFTNYGMDIMYGLPYQTKEDILSALHSALAAEVTHISAYELTLEEDTPLYKKTMQKEKPMRNDSFAFTQNKLIENFLASKNFFRYEVSNYAKKSYASLHNNGYWKFRPYIGLGASAHSFLYNTRYAWSRSIEEYLLQEKPSTEKAVLEDVLVGILRLYNSQSLVYLRKVLSKNDFKFFFLWLKKMQQEKLLTFTKQKFSFSPHVIDFSDEYLLQSMNFLEDRKQ